MSADHCPRCGLPLDNQHPIGCRDVMAQPTETELQGVREFLRAVEGES